MLIVLMTSDQSTPTRRAVLKRPISSHAPRFSTHPRGQFDRTGVNSAVHGPTGRWLRHGLLHGMRVKVRSPLRPVQRLHRCRDDVRARGWGRFGLGRLASESGHCRGAARLWFVPVWLCELHPQSGRTTAHCVPKLRLPKLFSLPRMGFVAKQCPALGGDDLFLHSSVTLSVETKIASCCSRLFSVDAARLEEVWRRVLKALTPRDACSPGTAKLTRN